MSFTFESDNGPIIVLDLANNHNGSVELGKRIIEEVAKVTSQYQFKFCIKFQYRELDTFIQSKYRGNWEYKYIKRFEQTRLSEREFLELIGYARSLNFGVACTPFDEKSVTKVVEHGFDFLKIASVSLNDWPLLEEIGKTGMSVVASTGGATLQEIDKATSFLKKRVKNLALMHCVAAYPTPDKDLNLKRIQDLKNRYENITIGYSTHEDPLNVLAAPLAISSGAQILERHIGIENPLEELNGYSSNPEVLNSWLDSIVNAVQMLGVGAIAANDNSTEQESLRGLRRGVYLQKDVEDGKTLQDVDVNFAIPLLPGQLSVNDWSRTQTHTLLVKKTSDSPLLQSEIFSQNTRDILDQIGEEAQTLFTAAGVTLPNFSKLEVSHHYGIEKFYDFGLMLVTVINREYCKKILGLFANQTNPEHYHKIKEETFLCVWGKAQITLNGAMHILGVGDRLTVSPGVRHTISTTTGVVLEEISTKHMIQDSFYTDEKISKSEKRKSFISLWN